MVFTTLSQKGVDRYFELPLYSLTVSISRDSYLVDICNFVSRIMYAKELYRFLFRQLSVKILDAALHGVLEGRRGQSKQMSCFLQQLSMSFSKQQELRIARLVAWWVARLILLTVFER